MFGTNADISAIATFAKIAELGGVSAAAKQLGLPKSTVSRRLSRLEASLDTRLIQRTSRQLRLTDEGEGFYRRVAPALALLGDATHWVSNKSSLIQGTIRISAPADFGQFFLSRVMSQFVAEHPDVRVEVDLSNRHVDLVQEGFDLAIRAGPLLDSSLIARKVSSAQMWLGASKSFVDTYPMKRLEDICNVPCITFGSRDGVSQWKLKSSKAKKTLEIRGVVDVTNYAFMKLLMLEGVGVGLIPSFALEAAGTEDGLLRLFPQWGTGLSAVHVVYPSRHLPERVVLLRDTLIEEMERFFGGTKTKPTTRR